MSLNIIIPKKQRALVLGGGGALGAYQVGVLKILSRRLMEDDKKNGEEGKLLFDVVAGTSIGAMNGAVLVSEFLKTGKWQDAVINLENFWTAKEKGLGSTLSQEVLENEDGWSEWHEHSKENCVALEETARRYYSVKHFFLKGAPRVQEPLQPNPMPDSRFFDNKLNLWFVHSHDRLKDTIQNFAKLPLNTALFDKNGRQQPRLLVFSVDVANGVTVTFDSYPKADGSRKSEYGKYTKENGYENVINYDTGISIDHVMASGTLPEFYNYQTIDGHKFWDGGLLSNTPFRELLQAHEEYWTDIIAQEKKDNTTIPDLEVYIVNLHPAKQPNPPTDHDGEKDRQNDILFGDRNSHYDEEQAHIVTDLKDFATLMKDLSAEAISKINDENYKAELNKKFEAISTKNTISKDKKGGTKKYDDLLKSRFCLINVIRIERTSYDYSIFGKTGDFTSQTIDEVIKEGERDALEKFP
jgi:NTE family protein